jgi:hypothetical protein
LLFATHVHFHFFVPNQWSQSNSSLSQDILEEINIEYETSTGIHTV